MINFSSANMIIKNSAALATFEVLRKAFLILIKMPSPLDVKRSMKVGKCHN